MSQILSAIFTMQITSACGVTLFIYEPHVMATCNLGIAFHTASTISLMNSTEISLLAENLIFQYYYLLNQCPGQLCRFYRDESVVFFENKPALGLAEICSLLEMQHIQDARVNILKVDALKSHANSIMVQVSGELSMSGQPYRRFMQTLTFVEHAPRFFFILINILHFQGRIYVKETQQTQSVSTTGKKLIDFYNPLESQTEGKPKQSNQAAKGIQSASYQRPSRNNPSVTEQPPANARAIDAKPASSAEGGEGKNKPSHRQRGRRAKKRFTQGQVAK